MVADNIYDLIPANIPKVIGDLPPSPDNIVAIMEFNSGISTEYFGGKTSPSLVNPIVKIVSRNKSYAIGKDWIEQINKALDKHSDEFLLSVFTVGSPMYLGKGEKDLHEFQVTFTIRVKE